MPWKTESVGMQCLEPAVIIAILNCSVLADFC